MESFLDDLRLTLRTWWRRPGLAALVVTTLALGIGASAAVFSVVDGVLLEPLPYPEPDLLSVIWTELPGLSQAVGRPTSSPPELADLRTALRSFSHLGGIWYRPGALTDTADEPEDIDMGFVSAGFLDALGVPPLLGRTIREEEDVGGAPSVIVLSHALWQRRYGGDPAMVGKRIELDGVAHTVVGIMPPDLPMLFPVGAGVPERLAAWVPWGGRYDEYPRGWRVFTVVARRAKGVSSSEAQSELDALAAHLESEHGDAYGTSGIRLAARPLHSDVVAHVRPMLMLLSGAVALVLLIACANVANLFLVKANGNESELSVRAALGASRSKLFRQLVTESALVALGGTALGLLLAQWSLEALPWVAPPELPRLESIGLNGTIVGLASLTGLVTALVFGSISSFHAFREQHLAGLKLGARAAGDRERYRARQFLVTGELALSLLLLLGAGLLVRSFTSLLRLDPGFRPEGVLTAKLSLVDSNYPYREPEKIAAFYRGLIERLGALAGIEVVGATTQLPLDGHAYRLAPYSYDGPDGIVEWETVEASYQTVTPGLLEAIGARLVRGRFFEWSDDLDHPRVVVIDEKMARLVWPGEDPIGRKLEVETFVGGEWIPDWAEVVGVVSHLRHELHQEGVEQIILPHAQSPQRTMALSIRSELDQATLLAALRRELAVIDPQQPVQQVRPLTDYLSESMAPTRFSLSLLTLFSTVALVLASVGLYGVIAYLVGQRTREIGIRLALGASPRNVLLEIMRQGLVMVAFGVVLGLVGAVGLQRLLAGHLFGVGSADPATFAAISLALVAVALSACYIPARRAAGLDPIRALREE